MSLKKLLLHNSLYNLGSYAYLLLASLLSLPFLIEGLSTSGYARYVILIATSTILSTFDLGLPTALTRTLARTDMDQAHKSRALSAGLLLSLVQAVLTAALGLGLLLLLNQLPVFGLASSDLHLLARPYLLLIFFTSLLSYYAAIPQGRGDFGIYSVRAYVAGTGNTLLSAVVALATGSLTHVIWITVLGTLVALLLLMLYALAHYGRAVLIPRRHPSEFKLLLEFGLPTFAGTLAPQLQANVGKYLAGLYLAPAAVSAVGIAQSLTFKGAGVFSQVVGALLPTATKLATSRDARLAKTRYLTYFFLTLAGLALILTYFYGLPLLTLWLGDQDLVAVVHPLLLIYLLFLVVVALVPVPSTLVAAAGRPGVASLYAWLEVILELTLAFLLLPRLGVISIPLSALISQTLVTPFFLLSARPYYSTSKN